MKRVIDKFILQNHPCVIYLSDVDDLVNDSFMDDLCNLINSGHIPDLYENDELESILSNLKQEVENTESITESIDVYSLLVEVGNLEIIICTGTYLYLENQNISSLVHWVESQQYTPSDKVEK